MDNDEKTTVEQGALSDEQRVKVLSPAMMVYKRFIRNRLAITGLIILMVMFLFSFVGGLLSPYNQQQVFKTTDLMALDFASATYNRDLRYTVADGESFPERARGHFVFAADKNEEFFESEGVTYGLHRESEDFFRIGGYKRLVEADVLKGRFGYKVADGFDFSENLQAVFEDAYNNGEESFVYNGSEYNILRGTRWCAIAEYTDIALASILIFDAYNPSDVNVVNSYTFRNDLETALIGGRTNFQSAGQTYTLDMHDEHNGLVYDAQGNVFAEISNIIVNPLDKAAFLPAEFKREVREAIVNSNDSFYSDIINGESVHYTVRDANTTFKIKTETLTELILMYEPPSRAHWVGTDGNGMDLLTRLMYGGRISLTVGFVVISIELLIGVILGGISGFFGGWIDTMIMRFVDLFNTIPQFPMLIILVSVLDAYKVEPQIRIYLLMLILGLMGWTGIARIVRGQILTLREQDFMAAAEATGLSVVRRIAKHLIPNVMPLLIVQATMGLGSIIITEATLSFLGLGVKYPLSSWGTIVNSATNVHVLTHYPFTWMPAGLLIFATVLGFNFVGDGLRDAFDPKMKR